MKWLGPQTVVERFFLGCVALYCATVGALINSLYFLHISLGCIMILWFHTNWFKVLLWLALPIGISLLGAHYVAYVDREMCQKGYEEYCY